MNRLQAIAKSLPRSPRSPLDLYVPGWNESETGIPTNHFRGAVLNTANDIISPEWGLNIPAQGNALEEMHHPPKQALKGRNKRFSTILSQAVIPACCWPEIQKCFLDSGLRRYDEREFGHLYSDNHRSFQNRLARQAA